MNPLSIMYIAPAETIASPPGCKLVYCAEMPQSLQVVGSNGLPQHTQFPYALVSFSRFGKHSCYVTFRKTHGLPKLLPVQNVVFVIRSGRSSLSVRAIRLHSYAQRPSRRWLWCMCSPWHSCDRSRQCCYPSQVTLRPGSVF